MNNPIYEYRQALNRAMERENLGDDFEFVIKYSLLALALHAGDCQYRVTSAQGWVLLEVDGDTLYVHHVLAFQQDDDMDGVGLKPVVWMPGEAIGSPIYTSTSVLVRGKARCGTNRTFEEIADDDSPSNAEREWIFDRYGALLKAK